MPAKWAYFQFTDPAPNSLVVQAAAERAQQHPQKSTSPDNGSKRLDLLSRKIFSVGLLFCIASYQELLAKYNFSTHIRLADFRDKLPADDQAQFQALVDEGRLAKVDIVDTLSHSLPTGLVMYCQSGLNYSCLLGLFLA